MRKFLAAVMLLLAIPASADVTVRGPFTMGGDVFPPSSFTGPIAYVESYRLLTDTPGDDTAVVQRACDAVKAKLGAVIFANKPYTIGKVTLGTEGLRYKCDIIGAAWDGDVGQTNIGGTFFKLKDGTNDDMFLIPTTAPPVQFSNLRIDGNKANNTCAATKAIIKMPDFGGGVKARSMNAHNLFIENACNDGISAGLLRNAGVLDHVAIIASTRNNISLSSNNDWRILYSDTGGAGSVSLDCAGCGSFTSIGSAYFTSVNGVKIESTALDVTFIGGSIDTNDHDGVVITGNPSATISFTRMFHGVRFNQNGLAANNTYADIKIVGDPNVALIGNYFQKGSAAATGGNYEKYLVNADASSRYQWVGNTYSTAAATAPYQTQPLNDPTLAQSPPQMLCSGFSSQSVTGTTNETVLATCTIPGKSLMPGQMISVKSSWDTNATANAKTLRIRIGASGAGTGGTRLNQLTINDATNLAARCNSEIYYTAASAQNAGAINCASGTAAAFSFSAIDMTADSEIVLTGQLTNSGDTLRVRSYEISVQ